MTIYFSRYMFFLWYCFSKKVEIISTTENGINVKTNLKELFLVTSRQIKIKFLIIKYLPTLLFTILIVSINEIQNLELIVLLAPLYIIFNYMFFTHKKVLIPLSIISSIIIFISYDILIFPIFIKYLIISYILIELSLDIYKRDQFYVYENNQKKNPVAFAIIQKEC